MDSRKYSLQCGFLNEDLHNPLFEIPGGMLFGTRIDLRVRPTAEFKRFLVALQSDMLGSTEPGVALQMSYEADKQTLECRALVGNQVIKSVMSNVKKDLFEDRFFVLSIATHPSGFKIYVDSIYLAEQRHFMDVTHVEFLRIDGDLVVYCAEVNNNFSNKHLLPVQDVPDVYGKVYEIPPASANDAETSDGRHVTRPVGPVVLPDEYVTLMDELEQQSHMIDEEIMNITARQATSPHARFEERPLEIPSADTSENEDPERETTETKKRKKTRFESFMKKIKKKGLRKKKKPVAVLDTSESEFSTDFENYLMGTDSDVSSRASPTEILQQLDDEELMQIATERMQERERAEKLAAENADEYYYTTEDDNEQTVVVPLSEIFESAHSDKSGKVKVRTQDGRIVEIERTKLRISTQVIDGGDIVLSESTTECATGVDDPASPVRYHVIHHHVHHHVGDQEKEWDPYDKAIPPPKYEDEFIDPDSGKPRPRSRLSLLCCYGV